MKKYWIDPEQQHWKQETSTHLEQAGDLVNDFFSVQFLAPFPLPGIYTVNLEARLMDTQGHRQGYIYIF